MNIRNPGCLVDFARCTRIRISLAALALPLFSTDLGAAQICRWMDESGRTQIAGVVPDRYKNVANCINAQQYELSPDQRREAERRAADEQSKVHSHADNLPKETNPSASRPTGTATQPGMKRPIEMVTDTTDCRTWWRIFDESSECFGSFRTARGGIKQEAFDNCTVVPSPELKCGPPRR